MPRKSYKPEEIVAKLRLHGSLIAHHDVQSPDRTESANRSRRKRRLLQHNRRLADAHLSGRSLPVLSPDRSFRRPLYFPGRGAAVRGR